MKKRGHVMSSAGKPPTLTHYGLGMELAAVDGHAATAHQGSIQGFFAWQLTYREIDTTFVFHCEHRQRQFRFGVLPKSTSLVRLDYCDQMLSRSDRFADCRARDVPKFYENGAIYSNGV